MTEDELRAMPRADSELQLAFDDGFEAAIECVREIARGLEAEIAKGEHYMQSQLFEVRLIVGALEGEKVRK